MDLKSEFITQLQASFQGLRTHNLEDLVSENLISPFTVPLPRKILTQAQDIIAAAFYLREQPEYLQHYAALINENKIKDPGNKAMAMSYDFHVNEDGDLKLIEINTNASFLLLGYEMYQMREVALPVLDFSHTSIRNMVLQELQLQGKPVAQPHIAIIDEDPSAQRLYIEFLAYQELFTSLGWSSKILDYREPLHDVDFIYNRHTDFMLTGSENLRRLFLDRSVCISPNPFEYLMLADKQRLADWSRPGFFEEMNLSLPQIQILRRMLPICLELNSHNIDEVWEMRKKLFFKPKRAFGAKLSYRGASVSRKHFTEFLDQDMIAQEYIPAPELIFETPEGPQKFKYDLRCYAYQGELQLVVARIYQGQVTNLRTPHGGFACVDFSL